MERVKSVDGTEDGERVEEFTPAPDAGIEPAWDECVGSGVDDAEIESVEPLQMEELWIALLSTVTVVEELRARVSDLEGRIEDHNARASHKI